MSEIRERAQHLVLSWGRPQSEFKEAITDLLAARAREEQAALRNAEMVDGRQDVRWPKGRAA